MKMKFQGAKEILNIDDHELELSRRVDEIDIITEAELKSEIVLALKKTIEKENITALSAPAIGYNKRIFCIKFKEEIKTFINPVISSCKGIQLSREKCTSIPDKEFIIPRNNDLMVVYQRANGRIETRQIIGMAALIFQHEMNHIDGVLVSDIGLEIDEDWDKATEEEREEVIKLYLETREEVIKLYLETLDMKSNDLQKEIQEDPELKQISDAIDFMSSVYKGETKLDIS